MPTFDERRAKALLAYIASKTDVGKTKLMKLVYLMDFEMYEKSGRAITNDTYENWPLGPVPTNTWKKLSEGFATDVLNVKKEETAVGTYLRYTSKKPLETLQKEFSPDELEVIDRVLNEYGEMGQQKLVELVHEELPYLLTTKGEKIPYFLAPYRNYKKLTGAELKKVRANKQYIGEIKEAFREAKRAEETRAKTHPTRSFALA